MAITKKRVSSIEHLSGTIKGKRFTVILDDIKIGDKWEIGVLPVLQADGLGKAFLSEGVPSFQFNDTAKSSVVFKTVESGLEVTGFMADQPVTDADIQAAEEGSK